MAAFLQLMRTQEAEEMLLHKTWAFKLLVIIAWRARRTGKSCLMGLQNGEALIGDWQEMGMASRRACRKAT